MLLLPLVAHAQTVATEHLRFQVDPATGELQMTVRDGGADAYTAQLWSVELDRVPQRGFRVLQAVPLVLENAALRVAFEVLNERAVAVTWTAKDGAAHDFMIPFESDDETAYYGAGERYHALNHRGYSLPMITDDRYRNKGTGTHKPVPFVMSSRGFGLWVDSYVPGVFDLNATERFVSMLRYRTDELRIVFFGGPRLASVLEAFTAMTGRTRVPPPWAFGLWKSRDVHPNQDSVYVDIEKLRGLGIPASVLVLDSPWETGYNDFEVNRQQFADAEAMFARIEALGFALCLWLTPFVNVRNNQDMVGITEKTKTFDEAAAQGYLVRDSRGAVALSGWWKGEGGLVDFTNPAAVDWWFGQLDKAAWTGVRAFKADDGEGNFVPDAVFHDGSTARTMKNRYAQLYNAAMQQYLDDRFGGDGVLIVRSGYTGTQTTPFAWAGDNAGSFDFGDGLPSVILAGLNAAMSGIALWGSDIAGYVGVPNKEVFIRWTQLGAFSPFMQVHMTANLGPWDFDEEALNLFRRYARLHTALFPYLYDAVHEAAATGMPVMRPMPLAFPDDPEARQQRFQYLYGPHLLVAPMYQPGTYRSVYLPAGTWYDFWTGTRHEGPQTLEVHAPLATLPLFVRAGALIPALPETVETLVARHEKMAADIEALDDRRVLHVWPGPAGTLATYDGLSASLGAHNGTYRLTLTSQAARPLDVRLRFQRADVNVPDGATAAYDADAQQTIIRFPNFSGSHTLTWTDPTR